MKRLWNMVSFLAIVNLVAVAMFAGWLWQSGRLDRERLEAVRALLSTTVADEAAAAAEMAASEEDAASAAAAQSRRDRPPLPSAVRLQQTAALQDQAEQTLRRLEDRTSQHQSELDRRARQLDAREQALQARQAAWESSIGALRDQRRDEQFEKTVRLYEALAGKQAKRLLLELVDQGDLEQAVSYLDAMSARAAAKTLRELKSDEENGLATRLLESLRTFGLGAENAETPRDDRTAAAAPEPSGTGP